MKTDKKTNSQNAIKHLTNRGAITNNTLHWKADADPLYAEWLTGRLDAGTLHYLGVSTTDPSTGTVTINGEVVDDPQPGDFVIYGTKEFVYNDVTSEWQEIGDENIIAILNKKQDTLTPGTYITISEDSTINVNTDELDKRYVADVEAKENAGIDIDNTNPNLPKVGIKIDTTAPGNVTLETTTNGLKASAEIPEGIGKKDDNTIISPEMGIPDDKKDLAKGEIFNLTEDITVGEQTMPANKATGMFSHAEGVGTTASGGGSHAEGDSTTATGMSSHAEGYNTKASYYSHAEGQFTIASANSHAEGESTTASGFASHAEGGETTASGTASHTEGIKTTASGGGSHAEGKSNNNIPSDLDLSIMSDEDIIKLWTDFEGEEPGSFSLAKGVASHVSGQDCLALGEYSHAEGRGTIASGNGSHTEGYLTTATGRGAHVEGGMIDPNDSGWTDENMKNIASGDSAHVEGFGNQAKGKFSHAEGIQTIAGKTNKSAEGPGGFDSVCGDHAEGNQTKASGGSSHAEGQYTTASGVGSHAEGLETTASGDCSHTEGQYTTASGMSSHAEGNGTTASGMSSHAEGYITTAEGEYSHAEGAMNVDNASWVHMVGIGVPHHGVHRSKKNAHTITRDGLHYILGVGNYQGTELGTPESPLPENGDLASVINGIKTSMGNIDTLLDQINGEVI